MSDAGRSSRRSVLKAAATGAVALGTGRVVATTVAQDETTGKLVFTYDDGVVEDYTQTYQQAHQPEDVPACAGVVAARVGTSQNLSESQLRELNDAGWEIMSHTVRHRALTGITVSRDVSPGDSRVYVVANYHGTLAGDTLRITDGSTSEVVTVAGFGDDGDPYIELENPVEGSYTGGETVERYTDDIIRRALEDSHSMLQEYGVEVTNIVMPYGGYGERTRQFVPDTYNAVPNAGNNYPEGVNGDPGLNPVDDLNLPHLSRRYFREGRMTYDQIASFLDRVRDEDVLGIFGGHSWWNRHGDDKLSPERIRQTIQMAKDRNIEVVTLQQALADLGYTNTTQTTTRTTEPTTTETSTTTSTTTTETSTSTTTETTTTTPTTTETSTTTTTTTEAPPTTTTTETPTTTTTTTESPPTTTETTTTETTTATTTTETTTTTSRNSGGNSGGNGGGGGGYAGGNSGGNDQTTTSTTTTATTQTTTATTTETPTETTTTETRMPVETQTSTPTTTPTTAPPTTETSTPVETTTLTETTQATDGSQAPVPGFGWLTTLGAGGTLTAYVLSRLSETDDEQ